METVLTLLLVRFAIIAAIVTVVAVTLFGVAVHLKRLGNGIRPNDNSGRWPSARQTCARDIPSPPPGDRGPHARRDRPRSA
ncbi:putative uncharacterized protein [Rhodococcus sp. AW25M09]|uniref:hypothetical protein n=1 Tax=Rhodococcus sp. AW25M09 TaxID=1268303 RepID=UPI0002AC662C|nr:hypothetical protein [Rhodococcus sp. AW25M09]CCQ13897.1 putative uncharacterized protein [Rhodococcus sp. AW25M09]